MQSPLHRLYKTKLVLASFIGIVAGYTLMVIGSRIDALSGFGLLKDADLHDIGIVLMTSSLIVVLFTYLGNEEAEQDADERTRRAVKAEAPAFVEGVIDAIADTPDKVLGVTAPEVLDRVIENSLTARLHDRELATGAYADLYRQAVHTDERWHDAHVDVVLSPWEREATSEEPMFVATVKWEFRTTPSSPTLRFASVSSSADYRTLSRDPANTETWFFKPSGAYDGSSQEVFDLLQVTVDSKPLPVRRSARKDAQFFTADLGTTTHQDVAVSYTYRTLVRQRGHLLRFEPARLTKGFVVRFNYGGCGISFVNTLDYIAGAWQARIEELPPTDPAPSVQVSYDGWVFPSGGVVFVWGLEAESANGAGRTHAALSH